MNTPECPVCQTPSEPLKDLPAAYLRKALGDYFREPVPDSVNIGSYEMMKCPRCTAEFSEPMEPGDASFYGWIARKDGYYPDERWEWGEVVAEIKRRGRNPADLLEVGCGSGRFLELVLRESAIRAVGLDTEPGAIASCREKGCEAYCEEMSAFLAGNPERRFDHVVAFHCLEHVQKPKDFLKVMLGALRPGGSVFVSTPYSPMSFETGWFDPLNHPPHHMTRWNARMYQEMAAQLGLGIRLRMPSPHSVIRRTKDAMAIRKFGPRTPFSRVRLYASLACDIGGLISEIRRQRSRDQFEGTYAADVVLAEFFEKPQ